jgi:Ca-activated chloride channel family protein
MTHRTLHPLSTWVVWTLAIPLATVAVMVTLAVTTELGELPFDNPHLWWLFGAVPLAGLLFLYARLRRQRALRRFASAEMGTLLAARVHPARQACKAGLLVLALTLAVAGVLGPRWGVQLEQVRVHGVDIAVAFDVSRSMLAADVKPNRLERAKEEIRRQLTERAVFRRANRLALLAFAGSTSLKVPLTTDHLSFRDKLEQLSINSAPRGGTAITRAIESGVDLLSRSPEGATRILLVFTDGEDHEGDAVAAARAAYTEHGVRVYTIGVGDPARTTGAEVPSGDGAKPLLYDGQIVISRLNVNALRSIAEAGGGLFATIDDFRFLVDAIAGLKSTQLGVEERMRHQPKYQWFIAAALALLLGEALIRESRTAKVDLPQRTWIQEMAS